MEHYSAKTKKETLPFVTTLMDLKDIMLHKPKYRSFHLHVDSKKYNRWTNKIKENQPHREQIGSC